MNPYLSRDEKASFVQLEALANTQESVLEIYQKTKSTNSDFLKYLRTSQTWLKKAIALRKSFLSEDAKLDFIKQASRLKLIFVRSDVAKKEYADLKELSENFVMPITDFEDWYAEVIEHACRTCSRMDWVNCKMHYLMTKYGVYPIDPEARTKCPYSYIDAEQADLDKQKLQEVESEKVHEKETIQSKEVAVTTDETVDLDQPNSGNDDLQETVSAEITLASGVQIDFYLTPYMAKQLLQDMKSMPKQSRPICASHVGDELIAIDTQDIAIFKVNGLGECDLEQIRAWNTNAIQISNAPAGNKNAISSRIETAAYKIECKCGAEYVCYLGSDRYKARCRECSAFVFRDEAIKEPLDDGKEATLMTNRYFVQRDEGQFNKREIKPQTPKLEQGEYQDPCRIFD